MGPGLFSVSIMLLLNIKDDKETGDTIKEYLATKKIIQVGSWMRDGNLARQIHLSKIISNSQYKNGKYTFIRCIILSIICLI
jgi:hypothetical protein